MKHLILIAALAAFWPSLRGGFQYDDHHSIVQNKHLDSMDLFAYFTDPAQYSVDEEKGMYRPLVVTTLAVNRALGGWHLTNLAIHIGCAYVVRWVAIGFGASATGALVAGLLFAVHPVCSEPVNYISARSESLAVLFSLLGIGTWRRA